MSRILNYNTPIQRLPYKQKTKQWRIDNIDAADKHSLYYSESIRKSLKNKIINLNLYDGKVDIRDLTEVVNPYQLDASFIPDNIPHHPILVPKVNLLLGEEMKRRFDWKVVVSNSDAVTKKEEDKKKELMNRLTQFLQSNYAEDELESKLGELEEYMKYDWQDLREKMANQILRHYYQEQDFESKFNDGFKDALLVAEEIFQIDLIHNEPVLEKLNPLKVYSIGAGKSNKIEDSSMIVIEDHWSSGKIVDYFHDELKVKDIDYIKDYHNSTRSNPSYDDDDNNHTLLRDALDSNGEDFMDSLFNVAEINGHYFNANHTDENGNIRVLRVYWKSLKKIKKVKYYDEFGEVQSKIMSEEYIPNEVLGEEVTDLWVNEWWEGTKIGKDIYVAMKPREVQFNTLNNPSYCHPGIIGQVYNTNQGRAVSLFDRGKNYQYMYDVIWDRLNKAISTNYGKIYQLDLSQIPDNWEIEKWLHFAIVNKIAVVDSFKQGNEGAATGKLAGSFGQNGGRAIDMETGTYIQQHIQLLEFIKTEMSEIAGVSRQREGQINNSETVGGVERSVNQSSHITEYWFNTHEKVKLRVLKAFLETAKVALKGNNKKVQYVLDDQTVELLNMDGDVINEADYGLVLTSSYKSSELEQTLKQYAQAFLQNGGRLSSIMDIYFSPSLSDMRRKLETAENDIDKKNAQAQEQNNKLAQQAQQAQMALEQAKLELDEAKNIRDNETAKYIAELKISSEGDGIIDESDNDKLNFDMQKHQDEKLLKIKDLNDKMKMHNDKMQKEDKKIAVQRQNKASK
jgi:hypothetical protein